LSNKPQDTFLQATAKKCTLKFNDCTLNFLKAMSMKKIVFIYGVLFCWLIPHCPATTLTTPQALQGVILAAGKGSRFNIGTTKLTIPICGQPMVLYAVKLMDQLSIPCTTVVGYQKELVRAVIEQAGINNITFVEQKEQSGTAWALLTSKETWHAENILVLNGDDPLVTAAIISALYNAHIKNEATVSFVTSYNIDPTSSNGRIVRNDNHIKIVEKKHFTGNVTNSPEINNGIYLFKRSFLEQYIETVKATCSGTKQEHYITDLVEIASNNQLRVITVPAPTELFGANNFEELAHVEQIKRDEIIHALMAQGVRFTMPLAVHIDHNVTIGRGTAIEGDAQLLNGTTIGEFCTIKPFVVLDHAILEDNVTIGSHCVIEDAKISKGTTVAPFSSIIGNK
jgi:UDP-N-acetylglucosamine diphosphorylase/glucosamine-1-phosphate N-acetyltransferase